MMSVPHPDMRLEVISALTALASPQHQSLQWRVVEEGFDYYDDLTLNINILYDDCQVLPNPSQQGRSGAEPEVESFQALNAALTPLLDELGERPDSDYVPHERWPAVVSAAQRALDVMRQSD
jgi:hypothetical protein